MMQETILRKPYAAKLKPHELHQAIETQKYLEERHGEEVYIFIHDTYTTIERPFSSNKHIKRST